MTDIEDKAIKAASVFEEVLRDKCGADHSKLTQIVENTMRATMVWSYNTGMEDLEKSLEDALKKKGRWR